jgi:hypothetical protein
LDKTFVSTAIHSEYPEYEVNYHASFRYFINAGVAEISKCPAQKIMPGLCSFRKRLPDSPAMIDLASISKMTGHLA